jgi:hypothetical protein
MHPNCKFRDVTVSQLAGKIELPRETSLPRPTEVESL